MRPDRVDYRENPRRLFRATGALVLLGTVALLPACGSGDGDGSPEDPRPTAVSVLTLEVQEVELERHWTGRMEPLRTLSVQAPQEGRVAHVVARDGDQVHSGEVLLQLEGPDLQARRSVLEERRIQLVEELARWRRLGEAGAAGPGEVAAANLRLLEVQEEAAALDATVETYVIRSPVSGQVYGSTVSPGSNVGAGQILLGVDDESSMGVRLVVAASETEFLERLDRLILRDDRGNELSVDRIAFASDLHPSFVRADLYLHENGARGRRGVTVTYLASEQLLLVPWTAVASDGDRNWVARVADGDPPTVERVAVELGRAHPDGIEVLGGLVPGDRVIRYEPRSHPEGRQIDPREGDATSPPESSTEESPPSTGMASTGEGAER